MKPAFAGFLVLLLFRLLALAGGELTLASVFSSRAVLEDAIVACSLGLMRVMLGSVGGFWVGYLPFLLIVAVSLPITMLFGFPITVRMLQATSGTLSGSIEPYLKSGYVVAVLGLFVVGLKIGWSDRSKQATTLVKRSGCGVQLIALLVLLLFARSFTQGAGLPNPFFAFLGSLQPMVSAEVGRSAGEDWRKATNCPKPPASVEGLRGAAVARDVVLILLESTRADVVARSREGRLLMPALAELSNSALVWENAYCVYPESVKGLFSILTSRYLPLQGTRELYKHGIESALPQQFRKRGYRTALFHSGRFEYLDMDLVVQNRGFELLRDAGDISGQKESSFGVEEEACLDAIGDWIQHVPSETNFFLAYLPIAGHHPYEAPGSERYRTDQERYFNAMSYLDSSVARLLSILKKAGRYENSMIVLIGDHGEGFGEHPGNIGHTMQLYEENVRVPFLVVLPGLLEKRVDVPGVASAVDLAPTLLDLTGMKGSGDYAGISLLRAEVHRAFFCTDYARPLAGLREGQFKFIHDFKSRETMMFDLTEDPLEQNDLSKTHAAIAQRAEEELVGWSRSELAAARSNRRWK
jgi:phosphoglycerol transferase MdoB-like AlkP superfamily enzyme